MELDFSQVFDGRPDGLWVGRTHAAWGQGSGDQELLEWPPPTGVKFREV